MLSSRLDGLLLLLHSAQLSDFVQCSFFFLILPFLASRLFSIFFFYSVLFCISIIVFYARYLIRTCTRSRTRTHNIYIYIQEIIRQNTKTYKCNSIACVKSSNNLHIFEHFIQKKMTFILYVRDASKTKSVTINGL